MIAGAQRSNNVTTMTTTRSRKLRSSIGTSQEDTSYFEHDSKPAAKPNQEVEDDAFVREESTSDESDDEQETDPDEGREQSIRIPRY